MHSLLKLLICIIGATAILPIVAPLAQSPSSPDQPSLIVIIRHADRAASPADDPPLSDEGKARAQELVRVLKGIDFSMVITSQTKRARETAAPIAEALNIATEVVPLTSRGSPEVYLNAVKAAADKNSGKSVLIVTHTQRIGSVIEAFGGPKILTMCEESFDHLFLLVPRQVGSKFIALRYGKPSQPGGADCI